nr:MAG TPA: hypothetical protein [Caudoviricetes sp.]DAV78724.1 MAG TPA: hypothetical protein [Caudoviricetes sp.]
MNFTPLFSTGSILLVLFPTLHILLSTLNHE